MTTTNTLPLSDLEKELAALAIYNMKLLEKATANTPDIDIFQVMSFLALRGYAITTRGGYVYHLSKDGRTFAESRRWEEAAATALQMIAEVEKLPPVFLWLLNHA